MLESSTKPFYHEQMAFEERLLEYDSQPLTDERRIGVAAHVIGVKVLQTVGTYLDAHPVVFRDEITSRAKNYAYLLAEHEFQTARGRFAYYKAGENGHIALQQMGFASKTREDIYGNRFFTPNRDHIAATHFLENDEMQQKIDAELGLSDFLRENDADDMHDFYADRFIQNLAANGLSTDFRGQTVNAINDSQFWLEQPR